MARIKKRSIEQECLLFHATEVLGLRIAKRISYAAGESGIANGTLQYCYVDEKCIGYQIREQPLSLTDIDEDELPASGAITAAEMETYAGIAFRGGKSRTYGLTEEKRLSRIHPLSKKLLPAEDSVELVMAKVAAFEPVHG